MRGKVNLSAQVLIRKRITPAYAGKSETCSALGLSELRITPAYAGKSYHVLLLVDED